MRYESHLPELGSPRAHGLERPGSTSLHVVDRNAARETGNDFVADGSDRCRQLIGGRSPRFGRADDRDFVTDLEFQLVRNANGALVHRDATANGQSVSLETDPSNIRELSRVAIGIADWQDGDSFVLGGNVRSAVPCPVARRSCAAIC